MVIRGLPVHLSRSLSSKLGKLFPALAFVLCWQAISLLLGTTNFPGLPSLAKIFVLTALSSSIIEAQGGGSLGYLPHVLSTSVFYTAGLAVGVLVGFLIGLALGQSSRLLRMLEPLLEFIRALPPLLFIPVLLLFVKTPYIAEIIAVATTAGLTIAVYVLSALPNIPQNYLALARLLGAKATTRIWHIQIPSIMPGLVGALRVASALSLGVAVVIEYLAVPKGIGRVIKYAMSFSDLGLIWTGITWVVIIALFIDFIILKSSHFGLRWSTRADQPLALHSGEVV